MATRVEAEAIAQLLDTEANWEPVELRRLTYDIQDSEALLESLHSNTHVARAPDQARFAAALDSRRPPPKGIYLILDRPRAAPEAPVERPDIPTVIGELFMYGRETDRNARVEFVFPDVDRSGSAPEHLIQVLGTHAGEVQNDDVVSSMTDLTARMTRRWWLPQRADIDQVEEWKRVEDEEWILNEWPQLPMRVLGGKPPVEAKDLPEYRIQLLACLLNLELASGQSMRGYDQDQLRKELDLPRRERIDPWSVEVAELPVWRFAQLDTVKLTNEQLDDVLAKVLALNEVTAVRNLVLEALARERAQERFHKDFLYATLANIASGTREALDYLEQARENSLESQRSPAFWLIQELKVRSRRGEMDQFARVIDEIHLKYIDEPGVAAAVQDVLEGLGLALGPHGDKTPPKADQPETATTASQQPPTSEIWTPESGSLSKTSDKPGLWLPDAE